MKKTPKIQIPKRTVAEAVGNGQMERLASGEVTGQGKNPKSQIPKSIADWEASAVGEALLLHDGPATRPLRDKPFDMEERTAQFGEQIVRFCKTIPRNAANDRLVDQLVGCGTSVGANYHEANEPMSKKTSFAASVASSKMQKRPNYSSGWLLRPSRPGLNPLTPSSAEPRN